MEYIIDSAFGRIECSEGNLEKEIERHKQNIKDEEIISVYKLQESFMKITTLKKI